MPNLLKFLPQEILSKEDKKFIYNILNPLLFEKINDINLENIRLYTIEEVIEKETRFKHKFLKEFRIPVNIDHSKLNIYFENEEKTQKVNRIRDTEKIKKLDDLQDIIFFYFSIEGYEFLKLILKSYYKIHSQLKENEKNMNYNKKKYDEEFNEYKKKIYKSNYEYYKDKYEYYKALATEFDAIMDILSNSTELSPKNILDEIANQIGIIYNVRSIDNEIIFEKSKLLKFLSSQINVRELKKFVFNGKKIVEEYDIKVENVFELISYFAEEISLLKEKYDEYLELLLPYDGFAYSLAKSNVKYLLNNVIENNVLTLESENMTYFLDEINNKLEIYFYFDRNFRVEESSLKVKVNEIEVPKSIVSREGQVSYGYETFHYIDFEYVYYKITINDYLVKDETGTNINDIIDSIEVSFDVVNVTYDNFERDQTNGLVISGVSFLDNFKLYKLNTETNLYEEFKAPIKLKIDIQEFDANFKRIYQLVGINDEVELAIRDAEEIVVSYYFFDEVYEPNFYFDIFNVETGTFKLNYQTILPYVLIDDVMDKNVELEYYSHLGMLDIVENKHKLVKTDFGVFKKNFDEIYYMNVMNPYSETNLEIIPRIDYTEFEERPHTPYEIIKEYFKKVPFSRNLEFLNRVQYDKERDCIIFVNRGKQSLVPLNENLVRGKNYERLGYNLYLNKITFDGKELCDADFRFINEKIYVDYNGELFEIEAVNTEEINLTIEERVIFFDIYQMSHCIILEGKKYKINGLYLGDFEKVKQIEGNIFYVEKKYGIARYKTKQGEIYDVDINQQVLIDETPYNGCLVYDKEGKAIVFRFDIEETYRMELEEVTEEKNYNKFKGLNSFSLFYSGNALPENSNKFGEGRENIYNSMNFIDTLYKLGRNADVYESEEKHELLAEEFNIDLDKAIKLKMEQEPYILFKNNSASYKGLESYLINNLKLISEDIKMSVVYLVQRNRFLSEWVRLSSVLPSNKFAEEPLRNLVADLLETKTITKKIDDLIKVFKNNEYENFSLDTNDINGLLLKYITDYIEKEGLKDKFVYYLIVDVWVKENLKDILNYVVRRAREEHRDDIEKKISTMTFEFEEEREKLYYFFCEMREKEHKRTIDVYKPISNYQDWQDIVDNNKVKPFKPFKYDVIDVSEFIKMPIEWTQPLFFIRPLVDDNVLIRRDYRPIDNSMITHSIVKTSDEYNEYVEEGIKFEIKVDYLYETLKILQELSFERDFDFLSVNLVIVKWIVERIIPENVLKGKINTREDFVEIVKSELLRAENPNDIIEYNKIKHNIYLRDLGSSVNEIFSTIEEQQLIDNNNIILKEIDKDALDKLDKIKKPIEHYFDFLFKEERYDIIAKVLALFTEDVMLTSMIDLSISINMKYSKGNEVYDRYEKNVYEILDEFLPIHTVLDKLIFVLKIMETSSSEAMSKGADVATKEEYLIDILTKFKEKINITAFDRSVTKIGVKAFFPSERMSMRYPLMRGFEEVPYDYDSRLFVEPGMDKIPNDDTLRLDDDWYIRSKDDWVKHDYIQPPEFSEMNWDEVPESDFEQILDTYISEYYEIKEHILERDNKIESHFVDYIPNIEIQTETFEPFKVDIKEDYFIHIDAVFDIKRVDWEKIGHDEYPYDLYDEPQDLQALIDIRDVVKQHILFDFYDKLNITLLDRIWTEIKVIYDFSNVPGHEEFSIDEYYHQIGGEEIERDLAVNVNDKIYFDFNFQRYDMSDISLINEKIAMDIQSDYKQSVSANISETLFSAEIKTISNKKPFLDERGVSLNLGQDEFDVDEYFHNSVELDQLGHIIDTDLQEKLDVVRIDFNFIRILPSDPYGELIDSKFYRVNNPKSEFYKSKIKDNLTLDIGLFLKDILRVQLLDFFNIDLIKIEYKNRIYDMLEKERGGEYFATKLSDGLIERKISFDFRENIILVDKFADIEDKSVPKIFGTEPLKNVKKEIYKIELEEEYNIKIGIRKPIERLTITDKDYLKSIVITEDTFKEIKIYEQPLNIKLRDELFTYYTFKERAISSISENVKTTIEQIEKEKAELRFLDRLYYGERDEMQADLGFVNIQDKELYVQEFKKHKDTLSAKILGEYISQDFEEKRTFDKRVKYQPHDYFGQMMYDDESLERSIDTTFKESFINVINDYRKDIGIVDIFDELKIEAKIYSREKINIQLSDSLEIYTHMIQQPRLNQVYDDFGHDEGYFMFNGELDEFDITTQIKDEIKIDTYQKIVDNGILVGVQDKKIKVHQGVLESDKLNIGISDDLKIISVGMKEIAKVSVKENYLEEKQFKEALNIILKETLISKIIFDKEQVVVSTQEKIFISEGSEKIDEIKVKVLDSILKEYNLSDDKLKIGFNERIKILEFKDHINDDELKAQIKETLLSVDEFRVLKYKDYVGVKTQDRVYVKTDDREFKDEVKVSIREKLKYGKGRKLIDTLRVYTLNRIIFDADYDKFPPDLTIDVDDEKYPLDVEIESHKERLNLIARERLIIGYKKIDYVDISLSEKIEMGCKWIVEREGVDEYPMDLHKMEYYNENLDNSITTSIKDTFVVLEKTKMKDTLDLNIEEKLKIDYFEDFKSKKWLDVLNVNSVDSVMYGIDEYDYIWDAKEWEKFGYDIPFEKYKGLIPHDEIPYGDLGHQQQGEDLSIVTSSIKERFSYGLITNANDLIKIQIQEMLKYGYEDSENAKTFNIWSQNEWENTKTKQTLEGYEGLIPYDVTGYDEVPHQQQGDDLSIISSSVREKFGIDLKYNFKEKINVGLIDKAIYAIELNEGKLNVILADKILYSEISPEIEKNFVEIISKEQYVNQIFNEYKEKTNLELGEILRYKFKMTMSVWDEEEWNKYVDNIEKYEGLIPYDVTGYDEVPHQQQGDDLSIISSSVNDLLKTELKFTNKDDLDVLFTEFLKYGIVIDDGASIKFEENFKYNENILTKLNDEFKIISNDKFVLNIVNEIEEKSALSLKENILLRIKSNNISKIMSEISDGLLGIGEGIIEKDKVIVKIDENLKYGFTLDPDLVAFYVWNFEEWNKYKEYLPLEYYEGLIPYDVTPHGELGHQQQGDDLSIVSSNIIDSFKLGLSNQINEILDAQLLDFLKYGMILDEVAKTKLKEKIKMGEKIYDLSDIEIDIKDELKTDLHLDFKETISVDVAEKFYPINIKMEDSLNVGFMEKMKVFYQYNYVADMESKYSYEKVLKRVDKLIDRETQEILDEIFRYRFYDKLMTKINQRIFTTALFKFDEVIPLLTKSKTKIDLYTQTDDGITRTFTFIKDRAYTEVRVYFAESSNISTIEKLKVFEN